MSVWSEPNLWTDSRVSTLPKNKKHFVVLFRHKIVQVFLTPPPPCDGIGASRSPLASSPSAATAVRKSTLQKNILVQIKVFQSMESSLLSTYGFLTLVWEWPGQLIFKLIFVTLPIHVVTLCGHILQKGQVISNKTEHNIFWHSFSCPCNKCGLFCSNG